MDITNEKRNDKSESKEQDNNKQVVIDEVDNKRDVIDAVNEKASNETLKATSAQLYPTLSTKDTDGNYLELQLKDPNSSIYRRLPDHQLYLQTDLTKR